MGLIPKHLVGNENPLWACRGGHSFFKWISRKSYGCILFFASHVQALSMRQERVKSPSWVYLSSPAWTQKNMYSFIYFSFLKMFIFLFFIENNPLSPCLYSIPVGVDLSFYYSTGIWQYNIMTGSFVTTQRLKLKSVSGSVVFFSKEK